MVRIKNWSRFQHFKDRRPPWIKLYRDLLDDVEWFKLRGDAKGLLINLWLIASENNGDVPDIETLSFRLRLPAKEIATQIITLSHWLEQLDIRAISSRHQLDTPEKRREERETEKEGETEAETEAERACTRNIGTISPTDFKPPSIVPQRAAPLTRQAPPQEFGIHVDFVRQFGAVYASRTGEPFNATPAILRIAKRMIDSHGLAVTVRKAQMLGEACENRDKWFTKEEGWAEFTIETLDAKWNRLIFKEKIDPKAKADDDLLKELKKLEEERERTNNAARR
jgi:hypothetical protein